MKFIQKDDCSGLVAELQVIAAKKFTPDQAARLIEGFGKIQWIHACQIVRDFERMERFPSNIYGIIANRIEDRAKDKIKDYYKNESWKYTNNDCASPEEWQAYFAVNNEIMLWHRLRLIEYNHEGLTNPMTLEDWDKIGRPKTWSSLLDNFFEGLLIVTNCKSEIRIDYLKKYFIMLKVERIKRMGGSAEQKNDDFEVKKQKYISAWNEKHKDDLYVMNQKSESAW